MAGKSGRLKNWLKGAYLCFLLADNFGYFTIGRATYRVYHIVDLLDRFVGELSVPDENLLDGFNTLHPEVDRSRLALADGALADRDHVLECLLGDCLHGLEFFGQDVVHLYDVVGEAA